MAHLAQTSGFQRIGLGCLPVFERDFDFNRFVLEDILMIRRCLCLVPAVVLLVSMAATPAWAHRGHGSDGSGSCCDNGCDSDCGNGCGESNGGCGTMTRTVYQPEYTTEKRMVERCEWVREERSREITVYKRVPVVEE